MAILNMLRNGILIIKFCNYIRGDSGAPKERGVGGFGEGVAEEKKQRYAVNGRSGRDVNVDVLC